MSNKIKVLQDLWLSFVGGYSGVAQDNRHIFNILSDADKVEVEGLVYAKSKIASKLITTNQSDYANKLFLDLLHCEENEKPGFLHQIMLFVSLFCTNTILNTKYNIYSLDNNHNSFLWKQIFSKTLGSESMERVLQKNFNFSNISWRDIMYAGIFKRKVRLNTDGYDFMIFPDVRPVSISPSTKKIIRYHDSFPILCPDFFQTHHSMMHINCLNACINDSYFVCNSEPTRATLVNLYSELENKTFVIPPVVCSYKKKMNYTLLQEVLRNRHLNLSYNNKLYTTRDDEFKYILALSTLEPRKNYINLIRAWENLFYISQYDIKLVIVANPGWLSTEIEEVMRPHVEMGNIMHLCSVSTEEMECLFSHASVFAALSYTEGFGIPSVEAMQCGCPILASNNSTHQWVMGESALYVDPYDVASITNGMSKLLCEPNNFDLRNELSIKGLRQANLYSSNAIKAQWSNVFDSLM